MKQVQDISRAALVRALAGVLLSKDLTAVEKRKVAGFLEDEIAKLVRGGIHDDAALAEKALRNAILFYRESCGLRGTGALSRRAKAIMPLRRLLSGRSGKPTPAL